MKENLRQAWKGALVKFSVTKQEQTREEDAIVPFVKNIVQRNRYKRTFSSNQQTLNLKTVQLKDQEIKSYNNNTGNKDNK